MPEEAPPTAPSTDTSFDAPAADTPDAALATGEQGTPSETPDADVINMRADYTRKTQELADQRREFEAQQEQAEQFQKLVQSALVEQDEEAAEQLLESLGYEFGEDDGDYAADPETAELRKQLDELNEWKNQQEAEKQTQQNVAHIESEFNRLGLGQWDAENEDHNALLAFAFANQEGDGPLNVQAGYDALRRLQDHTIEQYKQSKLAPSSDQFGTPASAALPQDASLEERARLAVERHFS